MKVNPYLAKAGRDIIKLNIGSAIKSLATGITFSSTSRGVSGVYLLDGDKELHFTFNGHQSSMKAYEGCPPVLAIINRMAQAYINGRTWILDTENKEATSKEAQKIRRLMKRPNPLQSWKQFEAQAYIYKKLFGFTIILPIKPFGFPNIEATALWNIPPFMVDIEETKKLFYEDEAKGIINKIVLNYKGTQAILQADDVYMMKEFTLPLRV
jgi:hypothetical protein